MGLKRKLYYFLPPHLRFLARRIYYFPVDFFDRITGRRDELTPPKGLIFIGSGDFKSVGEHYLNILLEYCSLKQNHRVLDIGSGIGRIAVPLTKFLSNDGSYEGFDIVKRGVEWCGKNITKSFPNFRFTHIDLKNELYNLSTKKTAKDFRFPYNEKEFDLVILTSVFTHMLPEDVENYFREIARVLKPGGKCLVTFFILNEESKQYMNSGSGFNFKFSNGFYSLIDKNVKEANIAFEEEYLLYLLSVNNFSVEKSLFGFWSGRPKNEAFDFQDTVILRKE